MLLVSLRHLILLHNKSKTPILLSMLSRLPYDHSNSRVRFIPSFYIYLVPDLLFLPTDIDNTSKPLKKFIFVVSLLCLHLRRFLSTHLQLILMYSHFCRYLLRFFPLSLYISHHIDREHLL